VKHYTEADLLETYYTEPGQSLPVMMHLAECTDCAARYERLDQKIRALGACEHAPRSFWARGRDAIAGVVAKWRRR
jgi:predicted anti-sigma-YlaC factor YlaD